MLRTTTSFGVALLFGASVFGFGGAAQAQKPGRPGGEHPQIRMAMRSLLQAEEHLERAAHHFGGHRAKALELVKQAEGQLKEALQYAQAHPEEFGAKPGTAPGTK